MSSYNEKSDNVKFVKDVRISQKKSGHINETIAKSYFTNHPHDYKNY